MVPWGSKLKYKLAQTLLPDLMSVDHKEWYLLDHNVAVIFPQVCVHSDHHTVSTRCSTYQRPTNFGFEFVVQIRSHNIFLLAVSQPMVKMCCFGQTPPFCHAHLKRLNGIRIFWRKVTFFPLFLCSCSTTSFGAFWVKIVHDIIHSITSDVKIVLDRPTPSSSASLTSGFHGNLWIIVTDFETSQTSL